MATSAIINKNHRYFKRNFLGLSKCIITWAVKFANGWKQNAICPKNIWPFQKMLFVSQIRWFFPENLCKHYGKRNHLTAVVCMEWDKANIYSQSTHMWEMAYLVSKNAANNVWKVAMKMKVDWVYGWVRRVGDFFVYLSDLSVYLSDFFCIFVRSFCIFVRFFYICLLWLSLARQNWQVGVFWENPFLYLSDFLYIFQDFFHICLLWLSLARQYWRVGGFWESPFFIFVRF